MLLLHAADIHLDSPLVGLEAYDGCPREALRGATRRALGRLVDVALEEKVEMVLLAGDLYDGAWRDYSTGLHFVAEMRRLREAGVPVVMVRGNHDAESQITKHIKLPDNVVDLARREPETRIFESLGIAVHGQGFAQRDVREDLARDYPSAIAGAVNVGLLHTALGGREGHETYAPTSLAVLADKGYDYWALGHVHRREVVSRSPYVVYPGNLQGRHVRETGPKGLMLVTIEAGRVNAVEPRDVDVVRWADCVVEAGEDDSREDVLEKVEASLEEALRGAEGRLLASRLTITGATRCHADLVRESDRLAADVRAIGIDAGGPSLWVGDVRVSTRPPLDVESLSKSGDPIAVLLRAAEDAASDPDLARELVEGLSDLTAKLPEELRADPAFAFLDDPRELPSVLRDVEELLVALLAPRDQAGTS